MRTKAVRLYGRNDLRLEEFDLPEIREDEILAHIISDSICMSSYKASIQGAEHKRVPKDVDKNPVIIGHEFCGEIIKVGSKWQDKYKPESKFSIQPALNLKDDPYVAPGYSFPYIGGSSTYIIIPNVVMEQGCLLPYKGDAFFYGSLLEPISCIVGAFHANYHTSQGSYVHSMGIKDGGNMAMLAGAGPMGLGAIDYALHSDRKPKLLIVTDIDETRLKRAASIYTMEKAGTDGIELNYVNTSEPGKGTDYLLSLSNGRGFDDVFVFAPIKAVVEFADKILAHDGCLNFFSGPSNTAFSAEFNFYNIHYNSTHIVGTSGGNTDDMLESLDLITNGRIHPTSMITHVGGLNSVVDTVLNLPKIPGGKKLIYTNIEMDLTQIDSFREKEKDNEVFKNIATLIEKSGGLWSPEAEKYLLSNAKSI